MTLKQTDVSIKTTDCSPMPAPDIVQSFHYRWFSKQPVTTYPSVWAKINPTSSLWRSQFISIPSQRSLTLLWYCLNVNVHREEFAGLDEVARKNILEAPMEEIIRVLEQNLLERFKQTPAMQRRLANERRIERGTSYLSGTVLIEIMWRTCFLDQSLQYWPWILRSRPAEVQRLHACKGRSYTRSFEPYIDDGTLAYFAKMHWWVVEVIIIC